MDTFSFDLVLNVDHCIIWSWTMRLANNGDLSIRILKDNSKM